MQTNSNTSQRNKEPQSQTLDEIYAKVFEEFRGKRYINHEKNTQFSEAWLVLALFVTLFGFGLGTAFLTTIGLALLVVVGISQMWTSLSLFGLHYERHFSETRAFVGEEVKLTLTIRNQKFLPLTWLQVTDICPTKLPVTNLHVELNRGSNLGEYRTFWMPAPFQRLSRHFVIRCTERGYFFYGPSKLATGDAFGLFDREATLPKQDTLIVYPHLYTATELGLPAKNPFGNQASRQRLFEDPLRTKGVREWQPSDTMRRIHWSATARHQEMLSRVYEPSEEPQVLIFLNVATLEIHWQGHIPELLERTISVAGSLATLCVEKRLPVGLIANGAFPGSDQALRLLPGRNPAQLTRILELLAAVTPFASKPLEQHLLAEAPRLPWGATIMVVTAIAHENLLATLVNLHRAGRKVILFTLAEEPPQALKEIAGILTYHLPHLVDDLIIPEVLVI